MSRYTATAGAVRRFRSQGRERYLVFKHASHGRTSDAA